jgi:hypothetical protein
MDTDKTKCHAPVAAYGNRPRIPSVSFQCVQPQAWKIHLARFHGDIKICQYQAQPRDVPWGYTSGIATSVKTLKSFVPETLDHNPLQPQRLHLRHTIDNARLRHRRSTFHVNELSSAF